MAIERAGSWQENEHVKEKKDVLGKVEHKLEGKNLAKELPDLITGLAKFRYPQDSEPPVRESKKSAFQSALTDVESVCRTDTELSKYNINKEDILNWCRVPVLESGDPPTVWENMSKQNSFYLNKAKESETSRKAENIVALKTAFSRIGLTEELMPYCNLQVRPREPGTIGDKLTGLPTPETDQKTYTVFMEFNIGGSQIKIFYDSYNAADVMMEGVVAVPDVKPYYVGGMMKLGPDKKISSYKGTKNLLLFEGGDINTFLQLILVAQGKKEKKS